MRIQVGVMGSAGGRLPKRVREKAYQLGREIAKHDCVLVTGACPGLPYDAVKGCKAAKGMVVGFSPALDLQEHISRYRSPYQEFDVLIYTGDGSRCYSSSGSIPSPSGASYRLTSHAYSRG